LEPLVNEPEAHDVGGQFLRGLLVHAAFGLSMGLTGSKENLALVSGVQFTATDRHQWRCSGETERG